MNTILLTGLALLAFAGNSVLCRLALAEGAIDAASFTWIRLLTGALVLSVLARFSGFNSQQIPRKVNWYAASMLFIYAIAFSYAYVSLDTGTGALILFGTVQVTMIFLGVRAGDRLDAYQWLGVALALTGLTVLLLPGASVPSFVGFILMLAAGLAWGLYSLAGKRSRTPLFDTASNFYGTVPLALMLLIITVGHSTISLNGLVLAILSGGLTSGIGYAIWYKALEGLSAAQAAVSQLFVPLIAALGGVMFAGEVVGLPLVIPTLLIMSGVLLVILTPKLTEKEQV